MDKVFKDKDGNVVIWQMPNIPLATWIITTILSKIFSSGKPFDLFKAVSFGALFTWALMELLTSVNYFRRLLGLAVLVMLILSKTR